MPLPSSIWVKFTATDDPTNPRDPRLPKLLELPLVDGWETAWERPDMPNLFGFQVTADYDGVYSEAESPVLKIGLWNVGTTGTNASWGTYSLTLDANNVGTTDCPFVEWIGELTEVDTFTESDTWTSPANIDTTKPVIVEAWGSGGNGLSGGGEPGLETGGSGGGGGAYASTDFFDVIGDYANWQVVVDTAGNGVNSNFTDSPDGITELLTAASASENAGGLDSNSVGDVIFSGGNGQDGNGVGGGGGAGASPYADGLDATSDIGAEGWGQTNDYGRGGDGAQDLTPATPAFEPGGGGGGGWGTATYADGSAGARGEIRIHYSLQTASGDAEVIETIELNQVFDNIELVFSTGGKPSKRHVNSYSVISGVRVNTDINRVD